LRSSFLMLVFIYPTLASTCDILNLHFAKIADISEVSRTIISCTLPILSRETILKDENYDQHWKPGAVRTIKKGFRKTAIP